MTRPPMNSEESKIGLYNRLEPKMLFGQLEKFQLFVVNFQLCDVMLGCLKVISLIPNLHQRCYNIDREVHQTNEEELDIS